MAKFIALAEGVEKILDDATPMIGGFLAVVAPLRSRSNWHRRNIVSLTRHHGA